MKSLFLYSCLLFFIYGCSSSSPTAPTLDTKTKVFDSYYPINKWDGEDWIATSGKLDMSVSWRFISDSDADEGVEIKVGYAIEFSNPTDNDVEVRISKLSFYDIDGIPIYQADVYIRDYLVRANDTREFTDTLSIYLDDIGVANQITKMSLWGSAVIPIQ